MTIRTYSQLNVSKINAETVNGDTVIMDDLTYDHTQGRETFQKQILIQPKTMHKATIKGAPIDLGLALMQGFDLQYKTTEESIVNLKGEGSKLVNNKIHFVNAITGRQDWAVVRGNNASVEGNEIYGKNNMGNSILVWGINAKITGNNIHDITGGVGNGAEILRVGASDKANTVFNCEIANNKVTNCNTSDDELFTIKSSGNSIHDNEITNCKSITLRHGHGNKVFKNKFNNAGLRIHGADNLIVANEFRKNSKKQLLQFVISNGNVVNDTEGANANYSQVKFNTIVENKIFNEDATDLISFCLGESDRPLKPEGNTIKGNIITASRGTLANSNDGALWENNGVAENILYATGTAKLGNMPTSGYTVKDPNAIPPAPLSLEDRIVRLEKAVFGT